MKSSPMLFRGAIALAVVFLLLAIYYVIPGIYHPFTSKPAHNAVYGSHWTHFIAFIALAAICAIGSRFLRPKSS